MTHDLAKIPVLVRLSTRLAVELAACEEGAYEDAVRTQQEDPRAQERHPKSHAHVTALEACERASGKRDAFLVIDSPEKADDMYYAVCSGTFKSKTPATLRAAQRIANILRPYAQPHTVRIWDKPDPEPFTGSLT